MSQLVLGIGKLAKLGTDPLLMVFDEIGAVTPFPGERLHYLYHVSLTCKAFYWFCVPLLYRDISIVVDRPCEHIRLFIGGKLKTYPKCRMSTWLLKRLITPNSFLPSFIRHLTLDQYCDGQKDLVKHQELLLKKLNVLKSLTWTGNLRMHRYLVRFIEENSSKLRLSIHYENCCFKHFNAEPDVLCAPSSLQSFSLNLDNFRGLDTERTRIMQCCADILSSCLQLETLDILASNDKDAIDENFDKAAIKFEPGSKIPRLRALSLPRSSAISWWDLDQWASLGGWSDLKSLQLQTLDHIKFFAGQTPKLESFILVFKSSSNELQKYETHLLQLGPLRELQIVGPNLQVPIKILSAYSVTLETLDLGSLEPDFPCLDTSYSVLYQLVEPSPTLEILLRFEKLRLLKLSCFIHEFGFDLNRNSIDAAAADEIEKILLNYVLNTKGFSSRTVQITTRTYLYSPGFQGPLEHRNANNVHTFELMYRLEPSSRTIHRYSKIDSLIPSDEIPWGGICSRWTLFSYVRRRLKEFGSSIPHLRQVALRLDPDWAKSELGSFGIERHISRSEQEWGENSIDRMTTHLKNINKNRLIDWKDHREYILRTLFCPSMERRYTDIETLYEQWWVGLDQNGKKKSLTPTLVEG